MPYVYIDLTTTERLEPVIDALVKDIPHVHLPSSCDGRDPSKPLWSPDQRYYVQLSQSRFGHVLMYDSSGRLVAEAGKSDWNGALVGWAHDSSGLYFGIASNAFAAPYEPLFKLSPLTPEEVRAQQLQRAAWWAGGACIAALVAWLLVRRWRKRRAAH